MTGVAREEGRGRVRQRERGREGGRERGRGRGPERGRGRGRGRGRERGRELRVFRSFFDFINRWMGGCGIEQRRFSDFAGILFCFPVCSRLRSSRGVPGASPTCCDGRMVVDGGGWMGSKKVL